MTVQDSSRRDDQVVVLHDRNGPEPPYRAPGLPPVLSQTRRSGVWRTELYRLAGIPAATRRWSEGELADLVARIWAGTEWLAAHGRLQGPVTAEALRWSEGHGPFFDFLLVEGPVPPPYARLQQIAAAALALAPDLPEGSPLRRLLAAAPQRLRGDQDVAAFLAELEGLRPVRTGLTRGGTASPAAGTATPPRAEASWTPGAPPPAREAGAPSPARAARARTPAQPANVPPSAPTAGSPSPARAAARRPRPSRRRGRHPLWRLAAIAAAAGALVAVVGIVALWVRRVDPAPGSVPAPSPGFPAEPRPRPGDPRRRLDSPTAPAPAPSPAPTPGAGAPPGDAPPLPGAPGQPPTSVPDPSTLPPYGPAPVPPAPPAADRPQEPPPEPKGLPIRLAIEGPAQIRVGEAAAYRLLATDATGQPVEVSPVWVVASGAERAWVDTGGYLHGRAPGPVVLRGVAVGHNVYADRTIQVVP